MTPWRCQSSSVRGYLRRRPAGARGVGDPAARHRRRTQLTPPHPAEHPAAQRGDGHRHRGAHRDRHGAGGRHRRHPQEPRRRRAGARGREGEEGRERDDRRSGHRPARAADRRGARGDAALPHLGPAGDRATGQLVGILTNRDLRFEKRLDRTVARGDDQGEAGDRAARASRSRRRRRSSTAPHREAAGRRRAQPRSAASSPSRTSRRRRATRTRPRTTSAGCASAAAVGTGPDREARAEALVRAGVDVLVVDTAHGHSASVIETVRAIEARLPDASTSIAGNVATAEGADGADQGGRRRRQGRHRPGVDLHDARRRRRRRAAAHRDRRRGSGRRRAPASRSSPTAASSTRATSPRRSPPARTR